MIYLKWIAQLIFYAPQLVKVWFQIQASLKAAKIKQATDKLKEAKTDEDREAALDSIDESLR